jgi:hypothetical protein
VIGIIGAQHAIHRGEKKGVCGGLRESLLLDALEKCLGAVVGCPPQAGTQACEQFPRGPMPAVPEVIGQFLKPCETWRDFRIDFERITGAGHGGR